MRSFLLVIILFSSMGLRSQSLPLSAGSSYPLTGTLYHEANGNTRRTFTSTYFGYSNSYRVLMLGSASTTYGMPTEGSVTISLGYDPSGNSDGNFQGDGREILFRNGAIFTTPNATNTGYHYALTLKDARVGIGTVTPAATLEIGSGSVYVPDGSSGSPSYSFSGGSDVGLYRVGAGLLGMSGNVRMYGGLSLTGNTHYRKALTPTNWGYDNQYRVLMIGSPSTTYNVQDGAVTVAFNYDPAVNSNSAFTGNGDEMIFRNGTSFMVPYSDNTNFYYNTMVLKDGKVGIGTNTPSEKFSVDGNIRARKVIVSQTGWSDYVFSKDYKLRSLFSLETFIKQNKHLPEMPSAKEVETKGISVGDNQALLVKKIEELTLYVIGLQKQVNTLQKQIRNK